MNIVLAFCVYTLDVKGNPNVNFAPLYTVIILFSWIIPRRFTILMVLLSLVLSVMGTTTKLNFDVSEETVMLNGFIGVLSVIVTYFLVMAARNSTGELRKTNAKLNTKVEKKRTEELIQKVKDLESHKSLLEESKDLLTLMQSELKKVN